MNTVNDYVKRTINWLLLFLIVLYNFHRYIFKYGDEGTSPTYTNTPFIWKFGKYIILLFITILILVSSNYRKSFNSKVPLFVFSFLSWNCIIIFLSYLLYNSFNSNEFNYILIGYLFCFLFYVSDKDIELIKNFIDNKLPLMMTVLFIGNLFTIFNFYFNGRLPSQGYEGGLVRFGSFWDDPNGFGFFSAFLLYYSLLRRKWFWTIFAFICIVSTVSFSAYIDMALAFFLWGVNRFFIKKKFILITFAFILFAAFIWTKYGEFLLDIYSMKQASANGHSTYEQTIFTLNVLNGPMIFHETWWYTYLINYSPLSFVFMVVILYYFIMLLLKQKRSIYDTYILLFLFGNMFIPLILDFPLNLFFFLSLIFSENAKNFKF